MEKKCNDKTPILTNDISGEWEKNEIINSKTPLLANKKHIPTDENSGGFSIQLVLVGFACFSQLFAIGMATYALQQYGYERFKKIDFPNVTFNGTIGEADPLCDKSIDTNSTYYLMEEEIQKSNAQWSIFNSLSSGFPIIFTSMLFAPLSDRYGRKLFLAFTLIASVFSNLIVALSIHFEWNIYVITGLLCIASLSGGWITTLSLAFSYVADITSGKTRTFSVAVIEILCGAGFLVSVFVCGFLIQAFGFIAPFITAAGVSLIIGMVVVTCVSESLKKESIPKKYHILKQMKSSMDFYIKQKVTSDPEFRASTRWKYIASIAAFCFFSFGTLGRSSVEILYQLGPPFCMSAVGVSNWSTVRTGVQQVVGIIAIKIMQCGMGDKAIAVMGGMSSVAYFLMEAFAGTVWELYLVPVVGCLNLVPIAMLRSIMSKMTPASLQGSLFAGIGLCENICIMLSSVANGAIYSATISINRGFVFIVQAMTNGIALVLLIVLYLGSRKEDIHEGITIKVESTEKGK